MSHQISIHQRHDQVIIYYDPVTQRVPIGPARLIRHLSTDDCGQTETWRVEINGTVEEQKIWISDNTRRDAGAGAYLEAGL